MIERLVIFDFDGTLFASPQKPDWWPFEGFWGRPESLNVPYVPEVSGPDWWAEDVVEAARQSSQEPDTYTVMMTGRPTKMSTRVKALLHQVGLEFDEYVFSRGGGKSTLEQKLEQLTRFIEAMPELKLVEMYDDRTEHIAPFKAHLESMGISFEVHHVPRAEHEMLVDHAVT